MARDPALPVATDLCGPILVFGPLSTPATVIAGLEQRLQQGGPVNAINPILGKLALCEVRIAAEGQGVDVVRWLLDHGADPSAQDRNLNTALHHYLYHGVDRAMIDAVLTAGPDLTRRNVAGFNVLDVAAKRSCAEWVQRLVQAGADVNAAHPVTGATALHLAMADGLNLRRATVMQLLVAGADPERQDANGRTPAQACAMQPCPWWNELMVIVERRTLLEAANEALAEMGTPAENGMTADPMPRRERRRLLIGA